MNPKASAKQKQAIHRMFDPYHVCDACTVIGAVHILRGLQSVFSLAVRARLPPPRMRIRVRRGLDIPIAGQPEQRIEDANPVGWVALVARDYRGLRPRLTVELGDRVRLGQSLLTDKANPSVMFASPGCGEVVAIHRGDRRSLQSVVVRLEGDDEERFAAHGRDALTMLDPQEVR